MSNRNKQENTWSIVRNRACIKAIGIFLGIIVAQIIAYLLTFFLMAAWNVFQKGMPEINQWIHLVNSGNALFATVVSIVSSVILIIWCGRKYRRSSWREEQFCYRAVLTRQNVLMVLCISVGGCIFLSVLLSGLEQIFPEMFRSYHQIMNQLVGQKQLLTILYVCLLGPVAEEIVFRGAMMDELYLAFPFWMANALQAALFGIYHMNLIQGLYAFCLGIILGAVRHLTGTILSNILVHILFNTTSILLSEVSGRIFHQRYSGVVLFCISAVLFLAGCYSLWQQTIAKKKEEKFPT